jgi:hypothetical protein
MSADLVGASVWEQKLYDHLTNHTVTEGAILAEYQQLAQDESVSKAFRYAAGLILDDERRHHQQFNDLAESIRQLSELRVEDEPIPSLAGLRHDRDRILETTTRLLEAEKEDAAQLKALAKELRDVRDTTLWGLLVELMQLDTDKHIRILTFIRDHATRR